MKSGKIPAMPKLIVEGESPILIFLLGHTDYPLMSYIMEYAGGGTPTTFCRTRMVINVLLVG